MKLRYLFAAALAVSLSATSSSDVRAEDGLELSGNVTTFMGWTHNDSNGGSSFAIPERGAAAANRDTFNFYLDEVELDLQKEWGDKVRIRADLDFGGTTLGSNFSDIAGGAAFVLEQGYVGFDIGKAQFAVGRFNAPIGIYSVDRINNVTISYSLPYLLVPTNVTGVSVSYPFTDNFTASAWVINNAADTVSTTTGGGLGGAIPTGGARVAYAWGEEGKRSTLGLTAIVGGQLSGLMKHLTYIGDLDLSWYISDNFLLQFEGVYRQDNTDIVGGLNNKVYAANLNLDYIINDQWDIYAAYNYIHDWEGAGATAGAVPANFYTGADQQVHAGTLGVGYNITDGAKFKMEYRLDYQLPAGVVSNSLSHSVLGSFGYAF